MSAGATAGRPVRVPPAGLRRPPSKDGPSHDRRGRWRGASGQATVELALLFPVVCGLLVLAVEIGGVLRSQVLLVQLTRQVARDVAVSAGAPAVDEAAAATAAGLDPERLDVDVVAAPGGGLLTVRAAYREPLSLPLLGVVHRSVTLTSRLSIRGEGAEAVTESGQS